MARSVGRTLMAVYADAHSARLRRTLVAAVRALLGWVFLSINTMLPFSQLPEMPAAGRVLLIAASVLSIGTGFTLLLWAADAVRERS
jgi:hypothetical protein